MFLILFGAATVPFWFALVTGLFRHLRDRHPDTYAAMGSPSVFANNTPGNNIAFLNFVLGSQWKALDDRELERRCRNVRRALAGYLVLFLSIAMMSLWTISQGHP